MAGEAGASLRELMDRMGHSSLRAALIYQHRSAQRDKMVADAISERVIGELADNGNEAVSNAHDAAKRTSSRRSDLGFPVGAGDGV
jgi:hypothetical protein